MTQGTGVLLGHCPEKPPHTVCLSLPSASCCACRLQVKGTAVSQTHAAGFPSLRQFWFGEG